MLLAQIPKLPHGRLVAGENGQADLFNAVLPFIASVVVDAQIAAEADEVELIDEFALPAAVMGRGKNRIIRRFRPFNTVGAAQDVDGRMLIAVFVVVDGVVQRDKFIAVAEDLDGAGAEVPVGNRQIRCEDRPTVFDKGQARRSSYPICPDATPRPASTTSSLEQSSRMPLTSRKVSMTYMPIRLLPSTKAWLEISE